MNSSPRGAVLVNSHFGCPPLRLGPRAGLSPGALRLGSAFKRDKEGFNSAHTHDTRARMDTTLRATLTDQCRATMAAASVGTCAKIPPSRPSRRRSRSLRGCAPSRRLSPRRWLECD
eukprot:scaffold14290_cov63-Phaeocystis_antarctica.AAC.5